MGEQARPDNIKKVLMALAKGYEHFGVKLDLNSGMKAFDGT